MFDTREETWIVVDLGGRWIKLIRYVSKRGSLREAGAEVIDIQAEGLLSAEEVSAAIGRMLRSAGDHPAAVVVPQSSAVSQVMDLPERPRAARPGGFEEEVLELIGLSAERCVYDSNPLESFGSYASPQWMTVAKEEDLRRHFSPLLGQGLRVEAATTAGNALVAGFRQAYPERSNAYLVDIGATQTTLVRIRDGEPVQMTSLAEGGENWTAAVMQASGEAFEEVEARLFRDDLFADPLLGPSLKAAVGNWHDRLVSQIDEWKEELGMPEGGDGRTGDIHLFGGYSGMPGLGSVLTHFGEDSWHLAESSGEIPAAVWTPAYGAALMAAGISEFKVSVLPRSLAKMRARRQGLLRLKTGVLYLFALLIIVLWGAIFKQEARLDALLAANRKAEEALSEIEASAELLELRNELAGRIEPVVDGQLNSLDSLETFRSIQRVHREFDFTLIRFADRQTYFRGIERRPETPEANRVSGAGRTAEFAGPAPPPAEAPLRAFVVELAIRGDQAERLEALASIVGRLREEPYFANVDRLVGGPVPAGGGHFFGEDEAYALLLTLAAEPGASSRGEMEGAGR